MSKLIYSLTVFLIFGCSIDRTIEPLTEIEQKMFIEFQDLKASSRLKINDDNEPGEKLILCLMFVNKEDLQALSGQRVLLYHTSTAGEYEPSDPNDESTARLKGTVITDQLGRVYIETILPGDYGSSADNRHIHTTVFGAHPEAYDIHFKQYASFMSKRFFDQSDQHFLANLKRTDEGTLIAFLTIEAKYSRSIEKK